MRALVIAALLLAGEARAEPRHALYAELLGKGGLWGVGYDIALSPRFAAGAALSIYRLGDQEVHSLSPYLAWYPLRGEHHGWFLHGGPQLVRVITRSPVPEWDGDRASGVGAEVSTGWEYRRGVLVRVYGLVAAGKGGVGPWLGASVGWSF